MRSRSCGWIISMTLPAWALGGVASPHSWFGGSWGTSVGPPIWQSGWSCTNQMQGTFLVLWTFFLQDSLVAEKERYLLFWRQNVPSNEHFPFHLHIPSSSSKRSPFWLNSFCLRGFISKYSKENFEADCASRECCATFLRNWVTAPFAEYRI